MPRPIDSLQPWQVPTLKYPPNSKPNTRPPPLPNCLRADLHHLYYDLFSNYTTALSQDTRGDRARSPSHCSQATCPSKRTTRDQNPHLPAVHIPSRPPSTLLAKAYAPTLSHLPLCHFLLSQLILSPAIPLLYAAITITHRSINLQITPSPLPSQSLLASKKGAL